MVLRPESIAWSRLGSLAAPRLTGVEEDDLIVITSPSGFLRSKLPETLRWPGRVDAIACLNQKAVGAASDSSQDARQLITFINESIGRKLTDRLAIGVANVYPRSRRAAATEVAR